MFILSYGAFFIRMAGRRPRHGVANGNPQCNQHGKTYADSAEKSNKMFNSQQGSFNRELFKIMNLKINSLLKIPC